MNMSKRMFKLLKKNFILSVLGLTLLQVGFISCKKKDTSVNFHFDYYPQTLGKFVIYDVKEISHSTGTSGSDTVSYQLKTLIGEVYEDNQGRIARKFYRYRRNKSAENWILKDTWTTIIADYRAELVEENQRIVKLVFAPTINKEWNANANNTLGTLPCYYDNIHKSYSVGSNSFDSTLTVEQANESNLIQFKRSYEVYAKGVGLIKKYHKFLTINNFDTLNISSGKELFMNVVSFGTE